MSILSEEYRPFTPIKAHLKIISTNNKYPYIDSKFEEVLERSGLSVNEWTFSNLYKVIQYTIMVCQRCQIGKIEEIVHRPVELAPQYTMLTIRYKDVVQCVDESKDRVSLEVETMPWFSFVDFDTNDVISFRIYPYPKEIDEEFKEFISSGYVTFYPNSNYDSFSICEHIDPTCI